MAGLYFDCTQFLIQYLYLLMLLNQIQSNWIPLSLCSECSLEKYVLTVPKPFVIYFARCINQKDQKRPVFIAIVWKRVWVTYSEIMQSDWLKRITRFSATNHDGSLVSVEKYFHTILVQNLVGKRRTNERGKEERIPINKFMTVQYCRRYKFENFEDIFWATSSSYLLACLLCRPLQFQLLCYNILHTNWGSIELRKQCDHIWRNSTTLAKI